MRLTADVILVSCGNKTLRSVFPCVGAVLLLQYYLSNPFSCPLVVRALSERTEIHIMGTHLPRI